MLPIANEADLLIFRCVYLVYDTNMYFSNNIYNGFPYPSAKSDQLNESWLGFKCN